MTLWGLTRMNRWIGITLISLGSYIGIIEPQNAGSAMLARSEDVSEKYIIDEFGTGKVVRSCFFNPSLNKEYRV